MGIAHDFQTTAGWTKSSNSIFLESPGSAQRAVTLEVFVVLTHKAACLKRAYSSQGYGSCDFVDRSCISEK